MGKLAPLLISLLATDVKSAVSNARGLAIFYAIAGLFGVAALAALLVSAGFFLSRTMRPEVAALLLSAVLFAISAIVIGAASIWSARQKRKVQSGRAAKTLAAAAAVSFLPLLASNRAGLGLLAAFAGYAFAKRNPRINPVTDFERQNP